MLPFLKRRATPPPLDALFEIPVLLVSYFPTRSGFIDANVTGDVSASLSAIRAHTKSTTTKIITALQEGSRFHGFKNPLAPPSLRYRIEGAVEFLEPLPTFPKPGHDDPMTDYNAIMERIEIEKWLARGVKEV